MNAVFFCETPVMALDGKIGVIGFCLGKLSKANFPFLLSNRSIARTSHHVKLSLPRHFMLLDSGLMNP